MAYKVDQLKQVHIQKIKDYFYHVRQSNKNQLSEYTGISKTTCTTILKELIQERFLVQADNNDSTGGRPSKQYQLNRNYSHSCLVYLKNKEQVEIEIQVKNLYAEDLVYEKQIFPKFSVNYLYEMLDGIFANDSKITVIAISIPGVVSQENCIISCDIKELEEQNLEMLLRIRYNVHIVIENDVNLAVVGYHSYEESLAFVFQPRLMYSGCGIMLNHQLYRGATLFAGEVGWLSDCVGVKAKDAKTAWRILIYQLNALICIINPQKIIIYSSYLYKAKDILLELEKHIPKCHLPEIYFAKGMESYVFKGMMEASIDIQRNHLTVEEIRKV